MAHHTSATERTQSDDTSLPTTDNAVESVVLCSVVDIHGDVVQTLVEHVQNLLVGVRHRKACGSHGIVKNDGGVGAVEHGGHHLLVLLDIVVPNSLGHVKLPLPVLGELGVDFLDQAVERVDEQGVSISPSGLNL